MGVGIQVKDTQQKREFISQKHPSHKPMVSLNLFRSFLLLLWLSLQESVSPFCRTHCDYGFVLLWLFNAKPWRMEMEMLRPFNLGRSHGGGIAYCTWSVGAAAIFLRRDEVASVPSALWQVCDKGHTSLVAPWTWQYCLWQKTYNIDFSHGTMQYKTGRISIVYKSSLLKCFQTQRAFA